MAEEIPDAELRMLLEAREAAYVASAEALNRWELVQEK